MKKIIFPAILTLIAFPVFGQSIDFSQMSELDSAVILQGGKKQLELNKKLKQALFEEQKSPNTQILQIQDLLKQGANPNVRVKGMPVVGLFSMKCSKENTMVLKLLLQAGAYPNVPLIKNYTPLGFAAAAGCYESVQLLLGAGADPFLMSGAESVLSLAVSGGNEAVVDLLLDSGLSEERKVKERAWKLACRNGNEKIAQLLGQSCSKLKKI